MFKKHLKIAIFLSIVIAAAFVISRFTINATSVQAAQEAPGIDPALTALKDNLNANGLVYITDRSDIPDVNIIDYNKQYVEINIKKLNDSRIDQVDPVKNKNIAVDIEQLKNAKVLNKIKEAYNQGTRIIFRKENITQAEIYKYLDVEIPYYLQGGEGRIEDVLTTVAVSVFKDSSGLDYVSTINVELNTPSEVIRAMMISALNDKDIFKSFFTPKDPKVKMSLIEFGNPVYANLSTNWPAISVQSRTDVWTTVSVGWTVALYKNPNNPDLRWTIYRDE